MQKFTAVAVALVIIAVGSLPAAAADGGDNVTIPGSARYFLQRLLERVRLGLTRNPDARAALIAQMIQRRAAEIGAMTPEQRSRFAGNLAGDMAQLTRAAEGVMAGMEKSGSDMTEIASAIAASNSRAVAVLQGLLEDGSMPGQTGLMEAVRTLKRVRTRSCEILEDIAEGVMPGNQDRAREEIQSMMRAREDLPTPGRGRPAGAGGD